MEIYIQKDWTTSRCRRLLRPITSRLGLLAKEQSGIRGQTHACKRRFFEDLSSSIEETSSQDSSRDEREGHDWARKRIRRTYTTKNGVKSGDNDASTCRTRCRLYIRNPESMTPGAILIPTSILSRSKREDICAKPIPLELSEVHALPSQAGNSHNRLQWSNKVDEKLDSKLSQKLRGLRKTTSPTVYSIYEGLHNGLEALLKATLPSDSEPNGPRSLLSTCLKFVPSYISDQMALLLAEAEKIGKSVLEVEDITDDVYDELEHLETSQRGWRHLRTVVRAHGIQIISDAIKNRLLDTQISDILVRLCIRSGSLDAAEELLNSLLSTTKLPPPRTINTLFSNNESMFPLSILWNYVESTDRFSYRYKRLSKLIQGGLLPVSWLSTKVFEPIWSGAIQALSHCSDSVEALNFIECALLSIAEQGSLEATSHDLSNAISNTFSSVLITLSAMAVLSKESVMQDEADHFALAHKHTEMLLESCLVLVKQSRTYSSYGDLILMANVIRDKVWLDSNMDPVHQVLIPTYWNTHSTNDASNDDIVMLLTSVARCCGRGSSSTGFKYLKQIHQLLESICRPIASDNNSFIQQCILDSAFAFAQQIPDRQHLDYAEELNVRAHNSYRPSPFSKVASAHSRIGFRWEEGISEWVTATPALNLKKSYDIDIGAHEEKTTPTRIRLSEAFSNRATKQERECLSLSEEDSEYLDIEDHEELSVPVLGKRPLARTELVDSSLRSRKKRRTPLPDDSEDELNDYVLHEITNVAYAKAGQRPTKDGPSKPSAVFTDFDPNESEDELCF